MRQLRTTALLALLIVLLSACASWQAQEPQPSRAQFHEQLMGIGTQAADHALGLAVQDAPTVYDYDGNTVDIQWLWQEFGDVTWTRAEPHPDAPYVFRLVALRAKCGPAALIVRVIDENGYALQRYAVIRYWPGAPQLPDFSDSTAKQWTQLGIVGKTNSDGDIGFGLGTGDYYFPDQSAGVTKVYVADFDGPGDLLSGLGMLGGTQHCSLNSTFQRIPKEITPPTPIPPGPTPPGPTPIPGAGWNIHFEIDGAITPNE